MGSDLSQTIKEGIKAPAPDICSGWNIRNKSSNANISALVPMANLYAIMSADEIGDLVRWLQPDSDLSQGPGRLHGRQRVINYINEGGEDTSSWNTPEVGSAEYLEKIAAIQEQLKKDLIFGKVTGQKGTTESVDVGLVRLAEMNNVITGAYDQDKPYGGVGINSLNGETANQGNLGRRTSISITMSDPNILDFNFAYQKLMTLNTKYIITFGWSNAAGVGSKLGDAAENFDPYPLVETVPAEDGKFIREIELDLNSANSGGFWTAQKMVLTKFDFNFNEVGQLEGNFTFFDEVAALLSSFTVADIASVVNDVMSSGETTDATGFGTGGVIGDFVGNTLAPGVELNQQLIETGLQSYLSPEVDANGNLIALADPQKSTDEDSEDDSVFGDTSPNREQVLDSEQAMLDSIQNFKDSSFPYSGPGIVQYDIDQRPLVFDVTIDDIEDPSGNLEVQQTRNVKEVTSRINFYYLGWILESMRYAMGQQSSAPSREAFVENEQQDIEEFGLNFYYEPLPENSLFALQYQRLVESQSVGTIPETVAKIMTFIDEKAFPKYNPRIAWEGWGSSGLMGWTSLLKGFGGLGMIAEYFLQKEYGNQARGFDPSAFINQASFNQSWSPGIVFSTALQKDLHVEMMARQRTWANEWANKKPGQEGIGFDSVKFKNMDYQQFRREVRSRRREEGGGDNSRYSMKDIAAMAFQSNVLNDPNNFGEFATSIDDSDKAHARSTYGESIFGRPDDGWGDGSDHDGIGIFIKGSIAAATYVDMNTGARAGPGSGTGAAANTAGAVGLANFYQDDAYHVLIAAMWIPWKEIEIYRRSSSNPGFRNPGPYGQKIDFLRWLLSPGLFQSTMKKWYLEYKKKFMKEIEGVVSRRLNRLKAEGRTYWDILHEPIDILWLTSNRIHQVYEDIAIPNRPPSLLMTATGLENWNYSAAAPWPDLPRGENNEYTWKGPDDGDLPHDWRLRTRVYNKRYQYSLFSAQTKRRVKIAERSWSPYRKEIPDRESDDNEARAYPSMNMLKLLWRRRQMNGVKWPRNYIPGPGGMIYDKVTKNAFWPSCQVGQSFDDLDIAYVPESGVLSAQQEELLKLFNANLITQTAPGGLPESKNILSRLWPGYEYSAQIESVEGSQEEFEETINIKAEIKDLQSAVGKRSLFQFLLQRITNADLTQTSEIHARMTSRRLLHEVAAPFNAFGPQHGQAIRTTAGVSYTDFIDYDVVTGVGALAMKTRGWSAPDGQRFDLNQIFYASVPSDITSDQWWNSMLSNETFITNRDAAYAERARHRTEAARGYMQEDFGDLDTTSLLYQSNRSIVELRADYYDLFMQGLNFEFEEEYEKLTGNDGRAFPSGRPISGPFVDEVARIETLTQSAREDGDAKMAITDVAMWNVFCQEFTAGQQSPAQLRVEAVIKYNEAYEDNFKVSGTTVAEGDLAALGAYEALGQEEGDRPAIDQYVHNDVWYAARMPWAMKIIKDSRAIVDEKLIPKILVPIRPAYSDVVADWAIADREDLREGTSSDSRFDVLEIWGRNGGGLQRKQATMYKYTQDQWGNELGEGDTTGYVGDEYKNLTENQALKSWWLQQPYGSRSSAEYFDVRQGPGLTGQWVKDYLARAMTWGSVRGNLDDYDARYVTIAEFRGQFRDLTGAWKRSPFKAAGDPVAAAGMGYREFGDDWEVGQLYGEFAYSDVMEFNYWCEHQNSADLLRMKELHAQIAPPTIYGMPEELETKRLAMGIISDYFARYRGSNLSYVSDGDLGAYSKENLPPVYFALVGEMEGTDYVYKTTAINPTAEDIDNIHNAEGGPAERFKVLYYNFPAGRRLEKEEVDYFQGGAQGDPNEANYSDLISAQEAHYPMRHGHLYMHENVCDPGLSDDERMALVWDVTTSRMDIQNDRFPGGYQTAFARAIQMVSLGMNLWPTQLVGGQLDGHRLSKRIPIEFPEDRDLVASDFPTMPGNLGGGWSNTRGSYGESGDARWNSQQNHLMPDDIITAKELTQTSREASVGTNAYRVLGLEYVDDDGASSPAGTSTPGNAPWRRGLRSEFTNWGYGYQVSFYKGKPFAQGVGGWKDLFKSVAVASLVPGGALASNLPYMNRVGGSNLLGMFGVSSWLADMTTTSNGAIQPGGASNFRGGWVLPPGGADESFSLGFARWGPTAVRDVGLGTGTHTEQRLNSVWKWVSSIEGMGHLSSSIEGFENLLIDKGLDEPSDYTPGGAWPELEDGEKAEDLNLIKPKRNAVYTKHSSNEVFGDIFPGGTKINKKYTSYLLSIMNLAEHNRRILINKTDKEGYSTPTDGQGKAVWDASRQDPTYGDAIGYGQSGKTYGDIGNKIPTSTAEIALRRDVVDNMLRPANHRMNLLEFVTQLTAPTTVASVGGQAAIACRNINGVLAVTPLGVEQDGWYEDYAGEVIETFEDPGPNFDEYFSDEEVLAEENKRRAGAGESTLHKNEAFYVYYKKQFSLVESINLTAKVDPSMMWANKDATKWFEGGLNRNFGKFLGWGNVAEEFKKYVARHTIGTGQTYAGEDRVERPVLGAHYSELITNNDEDIQIDLGLLQKIPPTFIDAFLKKNATMQSNLMKFYLAEHASDVSSIYKHYMQRVNLTIHGTCNLQGYQKLYLKDLLPGLEGIFQVIKVNQSITPGGFSTSIELAMTWQRPPVETTEEETEEDATWVATDEEAEALAAG